MIAAATDVAEGPMIPFQTATSFTTPKLTSASNLGGASQAISSPRVPAAARHLLQILHTRCTSILGYHGVDDLPLRSDPSRLMISPARLEAQVRALREAGFSLVTVSELVRRTASGSPPPGLVALTFDDGLRNLLEPLLRLADEGVPTSVYPVTEWIGGLHPDLPNPEHARMLDSVHLRKLADAGVEIGTHSATHPDLSTLSLAECVQELRDSRLILESIIERPVRTAAYPYGSYTSTTMEAAREAGIEVAVAAERGQGWEPLALSRARVGLGDSWVAFTIQATGNWPKFAVGAPGRMLRSTMRGVRRVRSDRGGSRA
jgi:peptidoglycan/xylan/chitin deacetylase (PgdA/CDA1 family)